MTRTPSTNRTAAGRGRRRRRRDRIAACLVVLLAIGAGLLAAYFGSPKAWEHPQPAKVGRINVPSQGSS